ncbi:ankyrin repeat domain-containing protein [Aspergillus fumigatus Af293]|uniref:NACHT and Ankyrin domain protein n=1 Tax=Aspergillus fumigatus (strain ATCC MYA-4609 / CBS 101355 / FGSC A1100 / Af293) TaxID=330879 RepID=Q4WC43_ASPFU|nr:NACHT and Ankyrin domain protein [Aspergillus fumigatus Af293]EAL85341.1 NACHT and Ankyrin domain protein [Aspergillus fumigatus Af293]
MLNRLLPHQVSINNTSATDGGQTFAGVNFGSVSFAGTESCATVSEEKASRCRNALFLSDPYVDRECLISEKGTRVAGTCEWITQHESYRAWLYGDTPFLWISGGPGRGKTMLSIFLTEELERVVQNVEDANLIFSFCTHKDEKHNTAVAIIRGLVYQIVTHRPKLIKHVLPSFETPEKARQTLSSLDALWVIFRRLVQDIDIGTTFCVIDGLDECDEAALSVLVPKLADIFSLESSQPATRLFKMVVISRDIPGLRGSLQVKLDPDNDERVASDIKLFIASRVAELSRMEGFNDEFVTTVQTSLLERSEGTFLWVGFIMKELSRKRTCTEVLETLGSLPSGLPALYSRMLLQIESKHRAISSVILRWVTMAARPLTLQELAAVVGIRSSNLITAQQAIRDRITLCGLFLKIQGQEVVLVHQSARDYLLRKEPDSDIVLEYFRIKSEEAHLMLAQACLDCLAHSSLQYEPLDLNNESYSQESPLLNYAAFHWPVHAQRSSVLAVQLLGFSKTFFHEDSDLRKNWMPSFNKSVDKKDARGRTALYWASSKGHEAVVRLLIERGANVRVKDKLGLTALYQASSSGHEAVVKLLLEHGADVNARSASKGWTALFEAASNGHKAVVQLLLDCGADVNMKDENGRTPLYQAASRGHEAVAGLLVGHGADINARDNDGQTALFRASSNGDEAVVQLLVNRKANVNVADYFRGMTPLSQAASRGHEGVVSLLLDHGADINAKDSGEWTALDVAAFKGHEEVTGYGFEYACTEFSTVLLCCHSTFSKVGRV